MRRRRDEEHNLHDWYLLNIHSSSLLVVIIMICSGHAWQSSLARDHSVNVIPLPLQVHHSLLLLSRHCMQSLTYDDEADHRVINSSSLFEIFSLVLTDLSIRPEAEQGFRTVHNLLLLCCT